MVSPFFKKTAPTLYNGKVRRQLEGNTMRGEGRVRKGDSKWDDRFYVKCYQLALMGQSNNAIASSLGVGAPLLAKWVKEKPALADALEQARSRGSGTRAFMRYVASRIPSDLRELWDMLCSDDPAVREQGCRSAQTRGRRHMQHLYVHALIACNFNPAKAQEITGVTPSTAAVWRHTDPKYKKLLELVHEAKGDFYENAFIESVAAGEVSAIIHAAKTYNKDRGYATQVNIKVEGEVEHRTSVSLSDLSIETKRRLLEEVRRKKDLPQLADSSNVQDAEFEELSSKKREVAGGA
jgi:hypothetical protein